MTSSTNGEQRIRLLFHGIRRALKQAEANNPIRGLLGATFTAAMDAFVFAYCMAIAIVYVARKWQSKDLSAPGIDFVMWISARSLLTAALIGWWIYVLTRWFRYIGWPALWAPLYVLLILCPWAWLFANRIELGGDSLALLCLQSPVIIAYSWRVHNRGKGTG